MAPGSGHVDGEHDTETGRGRQLERQHDSYTIWTLAPFKGKYKQTDRQTVLSCVGFVVVVVVHSIKLTILCVIWLLDTDCSAR